MHAVFEILSELHDLVAVESQTVPLHMTALMRENLGKLNFELHMKVLNMFFLREQ